MALSKEEMIQSIYKRYGVMFPDTAKEKDIIEQDSRATILSELKDLFAKKRRLNL